MTPRFPSARIAGTALLALCAPVFAGPADYVHLPNVEVGEREIDFKYGNARLPGGDRSSAASVGFGLGATERWFTEIYLKYEKATPDGMKLEAVEWENKFQLTETGKYPVDIGFLTEIEIPRKSGEAYEFAFGPLFQTEFARLQLNGNLIFERKFRGDTDAGPHRTEIGYQWQAKYRLQPEFEFGLQGFGEMGRWNHWDASADQKHQIGPAVFGKLALGQHRALKYNAAWLTGTSDAAPNHTLRLQTEFEF